MDVLCICSYRENLSVIIKNLTDLTAYETTSMYELVNCLTYVCVAIQLRRSRKEQHFEALNERRGKLNLWPATACLIICYLS